MIKGIRHILFDLGGVLLNLDYSRTEQAFRDLGIENFDEMFSQLKQTPLFDELETGKIGKADFVAGLRSAAGIEVSDEDLLKAWNAMLLDFPLRRLQLLQQLRLHYDLLLLSNTNEVHEEAFNLILNQAHGLSIGMLFDKVYLSHRIGMHKPDAAVFEHILNENGLKAEHTLFIDDSPQHIETAKRLGIQTIWLEKGMTIEGDIFLQK
ncbi:MAG: HAD family phosphatase [Sphingobacteriales bacterium]|nr:MAG: HAD family phosphatase [Sphingobacteriales bacterium]